MSIYFVCKATSMIVISFFEGSPSGIYVYFFNISTNVTFIRFTTIYLHFMQYTLKLTLPLEGAISFISTVGFRGRKP